MRGTRRPNYAGFDGQTAGCQFAQVAVDTETGVIAVEKVVAVHDCGRVIDTLTAAARSTAASSRASRTRCTRSAASTRTSATW